MKDLVNKAKLTTRQSQNLRHKLNLQAARLGNILIEGATGEREISSNQFACIKLVLDKTMPNLQTVDSTIRDDREVMTEEQAIQRLGLLLAKHPELATVLGQRGVTVDAESATRAYLESDKANGQPTSESH